MHSLSRRIGKIEQQITSQAPDEEEPLHAVDRLLDTPPSELVPGEPDLEAREVRFYYAWTLAHLSFAREQPKFYEEADLKEWEARRQHAESLVAAAEQEDETCDIRSSSEVSERVIVNGLRTYYSGVREDRIPL